MAEAGYHASERLGRLAVEETGYGIPAHKKIKNEFGSRFVWESIRDTKTVGVIRHDPQRRLYEIAWPMGVVVALVPSTNPTSTAFFKILTAVKARNAIVVAPHPSAVRCTCDAATTMALAALPWCARHIPPVNRPTAWVQATCRYMSTAALISKKRRAILLPARPSTTPPFAPQSRRSLPTGRLPPAWRT